MSQLFTIDKVTGLGDSLDFSANMDIGSTQPAKPEEPIHSTGNPADDDLMKMFRELLKLQQPVRPNFAKMGLGGLAMIAALQLMRGKQRDYGLLGKEDRSIEGAGAVSNLMGNYLGNIGQQNEAVNAHNTAGRSLLFQQILASQKAKQDKDAKLAEIGAAGTEARKTKEIPSVAWHGNMTPQEPSQLQVLKYLKDNPDMLKFYEGMKAKASATQMGALQKDVQYLASITDPVQKKIAENLIRGKWSGSMGSAMAALGGNTTDWGKQPVFPPEEAPAGQSELDKYLNP